MPVHRSAQPTDFHALQEIQTATLAEPVPALLEAATTGTIPAVVRELRTGAEPTVCGYVILVPDTETATVHVPEIAVHPAHHREGHGTALIEHACAMMDEYDRLSLTVDKADTTARQFYEAVGFEIVESLPAYFETSDGLLLHRPLS